MKEITKEEALRKCVAMWDWLADNPSSKKIDYYTENDIEERPRYECYACEYAFQKAGKSEYDYCITRSVCAHCPVWDQEDPNGCMMCCNDGSPYQRWENYKGSRSENAQWVADLANAKLREEITPMIKFVTDNNETVPVKVDVVTDDDLLIKLDGIVVAYVDSISGRLHLPSLTDVEMGRLQTSGIRIDSNERTIAMEP